MQRHVYSKEDAASPTICIESLLILLAIDALEKRDVATADIAGAFLKAFMDDFTLIKFTGDMVDLVVKSNPSKYSAFVSTKNGRQVLYVQLNKALYGCMKSAILWYRMFSGFLLKQGFSINPYDLCVANKTICGKQATICWYVDDLKISHVDKAVADDLIQVIESEFGTMNVVRG